MCFIPTGKERRIKFKPARERHERTTKAQTGINMEILFGYTCIPICGKYKYRIKSVLHVLAMYKQYTLSRQQMIHSSLLNIAWLMA